MGSKRKRSGLRKSAHAEAGAGIRKNLNVGAGSGEAKAMEARTMRARNYKKERNLGLDFVIFRSFLDLWFYFS